MVKSPTTTRMTVVTVSEISIADTFFYSAFILLIIGQSLIVSICLNALRVRAVPMQMHRWRSNRGLSQVFHGVISAGYAGHRRRAARAALPKRPREPAKHCGS